MRAQALALLLPTLAMAQAQAQTSLPGAQAPAVHTTRGFVNPESALWDPAAKCWYISNLASGATGRGGRAFISKLDADGKILQKEWVTGLDSPKGMGISGHILYIADMNHVGVVDMAKAQMVQRIPIQGARALSDIAVGPTGEIFVSDMEGNTIYRLRLGAKPEVFAAGKALEGPNGLWIDGDTLMVATWGAITGPNFTTKVPGRLVAVDLKTRKITPLSQARLGNLDGLVKAGASWFVSDYKAGNVFKVGSDNVYALWRSGFKSAADLGLDKDRNLLAIPDMVSGTVTFVRAD